MAMLLGFKSRIYACGDEYQCPHVTLSVSVALGRWLLGSDQIRAAEFLALLLHFSRVMQSPAPSLAASNSQVEYL